MCVTTDVQTRGVVESYPQDAEGKKTCDQNEDQPDEHERCS